MPGSEYLKCYCRNLSLSYLFKWKCDTK